MSLLLSYFNRQVAEISETSALRYFGVALNLISILTAYFWWTSYVSAESSAYCWYYFTNCLITRSFVADHHQFFCLLLVGVSLCSGHFFFKAKTHWAYGLLMLGLLLKFFLFSQDYRLMGNYHFMHFLVALFYLFAPDKIRSIYFLIPIFYIGAGLLKFNPEWLSGSAMLRELFFPLPLHYPAFLFVILLELVVVPLLFVVSFRSRGWWLILANLIIFHLVSWQGVGYFYPLTMFSILSFYFLIRALPENFKSSVGPLLLFVFFGLQVVRVFAYPEANIDGVGRSFSLNMLDGKPDCINQIILNSDSKTILTSYVPETKAPRIMCDPLIYVAYLKKICKEIEPKFRVDFLLQTRLQTESKYHDVLNVRDACRHDLSMNFLGKLNL